MNADITIRLATLADAENLAALFAEDYAFYELYVPPMADLIAHLQSDVVGPDSGAEVLYAHQDDTPVGFAIAAVLFPAPGGSGQMYMKELFISDVYRSVGLGKKMMRAMAQRAVTLGCSRLDWTAETTNPEAVAFYQHLGATLLERKRYFRLDGETLKRFAD